jgi:glycosyltransferase involved in cell wall biosynthesis
MRILIVSRGYPTEKYPLNGIFEFDQAKALAEAGHEVIFAANDMRSIRRWRKWGIEEKIIDGVKIYAFNIPCGRVPTKWLEWISIKALRYLYSYIERKCGRPDIIHSHFLNQGYSAVNALKEKGIPIIHTEHYSVMNQKELDQHTQYLGEYTYNNVDQVIAVSRCLATSIKEKFGVEPIVIPNIVDTTVFHYSAMRHSDDEVFFISVGGLIKTKRMDLLISAFHRAFEGNTKIFLYIYGQGPERKNLENLIRQYHLEEQIFLMGLASREVIAKKMQESDCFVLASERETFGVVYIEAMATGLPVIATKCGGPEDFVDNSNGIMVPTNNAECLANAMKSMHLNINQYDKPTISSDTKAKFSPQAVAMKIIGVYEEILEMGKRE